MSAVGAVAVLGASGVAVDWAAGVASEVAAGAVSGVVAGAGALAGSESNRLPVLCFAAPYVSVSEVSIKMIALALVSFVRTFPAPELPNKV